MISGDKSKLHTVYFDWNPLMKEDFRSIPVLEDQYLPASEETHWTKLLKSTEKLKALFLRSCNLSDADVAGLCKALETNQGLRVLDLSANHLTAKSVESLCGLLDKNKTIEFIGLARNGLRFEDVSPLLDRMG